MMTPINLLEELKKYIEEKTENILLPVKQRKGERQADRPPNVYLMNTPTKEGETQQIPYIILKYLTGKDEEEETSQVAVRIIIAVYEEDAEAGAIGLLNVISNIRYNLMKDRQLAKRFNLILPMENIIYPDDTRPYYLGEIMTNWTIPPVRRELKEYGN